MPANPATGIDYETDRFAYVHNPDENTFTVLNLNAQWPRSDGGAIVGGNPDYKYFKRVETTRPDADHRYALSNQWDFETFDPAPAEGLPVGEYKQSWTATKLDNATLKQQVDAQFYQEVRTQFPELDDPAKVLQAVEAVARKQAVGTITVPQQASIDNIVAIGNAVAVMADRRDELYAAIDADEDYDIETGWDGLS